MRTAPTARPHRRDPRAEHRAALLPRLTFVLLLGATATAGVAASPRAPSAREPGSRLPLVVAEIPAAARATGADTSGEGGRLVLVDPRGRRRVLTSGFASAADPDVSFDGSTILFAGKERATDPWCIWEMRRDGSGRRKITCGAAGARQPVYQSTIYTITTTAVEPWVQIAFVGVDPGERDEAGATEHTSLWSCKTDGTALRRLTFSLSNDVDPVILPDGRMLYASTLRRPSAADADDRIALVGVNEDGTDAQIYAGVQGLRVQRMPAPTANGLVVFVESTDGGGLAGRLASVTQVRPLHSYRSLTSDADGWFRAPAPLDDGRVLVAWRSGEANSVFAIYRFDPASGTREPVFAERGWHALEAHVLAARTAPDDRSSVVRTDDELGTLYTVSVDINDLGERWQPGTAKALRVLEGVPATASRPSSRRVLGEIPIADDGSYQVRVPANVPLQLQTLDAQGKALRTSSWLWVRNHAAQGCVGCHEDPERTPPNRLMKALASPAPVLNPPVDERRPLDAGTATRNAPMRCVSCHGSSPASPGVGAAGVHGRTGGGR